MVSDHPQVLAVQLMTLNLLFFSVFTDHPFLPRALHCLHPTVQLFSWQILPSTLLTPLTIYLVILTTILTLLALITELMSQLTRRLYSGSSLLP